MTKKFGFVVNIAYGTVILVILLQDYNKCGHQAEWALGCCAYFYFLLRFLR